jgi:mycothiol synthase
MPLEIRPLRDTEIEALRALLTHPSLAVEFDVFSSPGQLEHVLADPHTDRRLCTVAWQDGTALGFTQGYAIPQADGSRHVFLRLGVHADARRRGAGTALLANVFATARAWAPGERPRHIAFNHWVPNDGDEAFWMRHGFAPVRYFWRMQRATDASLTPEWPAGIEARLFGGNNREFADWNDAYNDSFAAHYRFIPGTVEIARAIAASPDFKHEYLMLAYRNGRCVGFCRNEAIGDTGVIGVLGVAREARGSGLGRALLRWGVASLSRQGFARIALYVDGENDTALGLYRSEGFEVARTRRYWEKAL